MHIESLKIWDGSYMPKFGIGTWELGEKPELRNDELEALEAGINQGVSMIDTAEMYGNGLSEELVGEAIKGVSRESLYLVSKVLPSNAGGNRLEKSLDASLKRMGVDYLDMYLYHWRGTYSLEETVDKMEDMVQKGKILHWGVSNFDTDDMEELLSVPHGNHCSVNQVLYHLGSRGIEYDLMPFLKEKGIPVMAYCPLAQGGSLRNQILSNTVLQEVANKYSISVMQLLLAFVMRNEIVCPIPKSGKKEHVLQNLKALEIEISDQDISRIDKAFPAPDHKTYLDTV